MNDLYESNYIHQEIIDEMEPYELENLMTELAYLNKQIQNRKKVVIDPGGKFQQIYNILTGKRRKIQNKIELDVTEAIEIVSSILPILSKDIHLIKTNQAEIEKKLLDLTSITVLFLVYADQNLIQLSPEIKNELLLLIDPSVEHSDNKYLIPSNKKTGSDYMPESNEDSKYSHEQRKELDILLEDPKQKEKIEALRRDGYSDKEIEEQYSRTAVYAKSKEELKEYIERKEPEIIVEGKLAKQLKKCESLKKATPAKIAILTASVGVVGATIAAMIIAGGPTVGISYFLGTPAIVAEAGIIGSSFGIGTFAAITMLILASSLSVAVLVSVFNDYDTEFEGDVGPMRLKLKRKKEK